MKNEKVAHELLKVARMLCADDESDAAQELLKGYKYVDANKDFETKELSCADGRLEFDVVIIDKLAELSVVVELGQDENGFSGEVTTKWNFDQKFYKNCHFKPATAPVKTAVKGDEQTIAKAITDIVAECTKGLTVVKK